MINKLCLLSLLEAPTQLAQYWAIPFNKGTPLPLWMTNTPGPLGQTVVYEELKLQKFTTEYRDILLCVNTPWDSGTLIKWNSLLMQWQCQLHLVSPLSSSAAVPT